MKKYTYNTAVLLNEDDISYYLLGVFMSDGCIRRSGRTSYSSTIGSKDKEWLETIRNLFDNNIKLESYDGFYKFNINNKIIGEWFLSNKCTPNKSLTLEMPNIPEKYLADFIRGIFDGDGSLTVYTDQRKQAKDFSSYICSSSITFISQLQKILNAHNIKSNIIEIKRNKTNLNKSGKEITQRHKHWRLSFNKTQTLAFLDFIYYEDHKISLTSKFEKFKSMKKIYTQEKLTNNQLNKNTKISWPSDEELINLVKINTYKSIGKMRGVSNVSVVSRMKARGIYLPKGRGKGSHQKQFTCVS